MNTPSLTVAVPVFNAMPYLPEAIDSVLKQTYGEFRLLLVNDGSTDDSAEFLDGLKDPRITLVHSKNRGLGATLNEVIDSCDTEYIARMDADDVSLPDRLKLQMEYIKEHSDIVMLGTQVEFFAGERTFSGPVKPLKHESIHELLLKRKAAICHASCLFRTDALKKSGGYRINRAGQDTDLFLRMCEIGKAANLDNTLYRIRVHGDSTCYTDWDKINRGRAYAVECARLRLEDKPETDYDTFISEWEHRPASRKLADVIDNWSAVQYRNSMIDRGEGRSISGGVRMLLAALCRPEAVARRIKGKSGGS